MSFVLTLPIPPSVNAAYANRKSGRGRGRYKTKAYKDWLINADRWAQTQWRKIEPVTGPAMVCIKLPMKMRGDISNRIKVAEDFLVSRGLTSDDSENRFVGAVRSVEVPDGLCQIVVKPA
jgi:Holliday junction resolvase RusA-like endonuclease